MSWPKKPLAEVADFQLGKMLDQVKNRGDSRPYLANKNVRWGNFDFSELRDMRFEESEFERFSLKNGDIVMCEGGEPGRCAIWRDELPNMMFQKALHRIRPFEGMDSVFLYYNLSHRARSGHFNGLLTGATIKHLPREKLALVQVDVPDLPTQQRIAGILSAYDDLIENNRRRIGLLEHAARLLYREWFVHLRFPGHETAKIIDGLPERWERATLSDHVALVKDAVQPGAFRPDDVHIGLEHIPRRSFVLSEWEPTEGLESHKFRFEAGDIIFGKIRPYFHKVGFAMRDGVASSDAFVWRVKDQRTWSLIVCATSSDHFVAVASKTVKEGSKMPRADWKVLAKYEIPKPTDDVLAEFDGRVRPIADECRKLALQNRALTRARDLLLPRLMDGRIPV